MLCNNSTCNSYHRYHRLHKCYNSKWKKLQLKLILNCINCMDILEYRTVSSFGSKLTCTNCMPSSQTGNPHSTTHLPLQKMSMCMLFPLSIETNHAHYCCLSHKRNNSKSMNFHLVYKHHLILVIHCYLKLSSRRRMLVFKCKI